MKFTFPKDVKGWLSLEEGKLLFNLASKNPNFGHVVELGSYHGRSTICLAQGSKKVKGGKIFTVDHFKGDRLLGWEKSFYKNLCQNIKRYELEQDVSIIKGDTLKVAKKWHLPIRLLFIDTSHEYKNVVNDFNAWEKYVVPEGLVVFHDSLAWPGVSKFVCQLIKTGRYKNFKTLSGDKTPGITYAQKAKPKTVNNFEIVKNLFQFGLTWSFKKTKDLKHPGFCNLLLRRFANFLKRTLFGGSLRKHYES